MFSTVKNMNINLMEIIKLFQIWIQNPKRYYSFDFSVIQRSQKEGSDGLEFGDPVLAPFGRAKKKKYF